MFQSRSRDSASRKIEMAEGELISTHVSVPIAGFSKSKVNQSVRPISGMGGFSPDRGIQQVESRGVKATRNPDYAFQSRSRDSASRKRRLKLVLRLLQSRFSPDRGIQQVESPESSCVQLPLCLPSFSPDRGIQQVESKKEGGIPPLSMMFQSRSRDSASRKRFQD